MRIFGRKVLKKKKKNAFNVQFFFPDHQNLLKTYTHTFSQKGGELQNVFNTLNY